MPPYYLTVLFLVIFFWSYCLLFCFSFFSDLHTCFSLCEMLLRKWKWSQDCWMSEGSHWVRCTLLSCWTTSMIWKLKERKNLKRPVRLCRCCCSRTWLHCLWLVCKLSSFLFFLFKASNYILSCAVDYKVAFKANSLFKVPVEQLPYTPPPKDSQALAMRAKDRVGRRDRREQETMKDPEAELAKMRISPQRMQLHVSNSCFVLWNFRQLLLMRCTYDLSLDSSVWTAFESAGRVQVQKSVHSARSGAGRTVAEVGQY